MRAQIFPFSSFTTTHWRTASPKLEGFFEARYPGWEIALFGHIGDGNLHVNVMKPDALGRAEFLAKTKGADHAIFALVKKHRGSIQVLPHALEQPKRLGGMRTRLHARRKGLAILARGRLGIQRQTVIRHAVRLGSQVRA